MLTSLSTRRSTIVTKLVTASLSLIAAIVASTVITESAHAAAVRAGQFNANTLAGNDDASTGLVGIGFNANFFGTNFSQLYVNNNGNVTLNAPLSNFTPFGITGASTPIIAPFFADVDTRGVGSGQVTYGAGTVDGYQAFGVDWPRVGYFPGATDKLNTFQLVLINRSDTGAGNFDIEFNYDQIRWETGGASSGTNGLGGSSARAGFSNGAGNFFELTGSGVNGAFLNGGPNSLIANRLSSNVDGRYLFAARNGSIVNPAPIPTPALLPGLIGLGLGVLRKRKAEAAESANAA